MFRIRITFTTLLFFFLFTGAKTSSDKTYTVYINYPDYSVRADVLQEPVKIHPKQDRFYYWYSNNDIKKTQGAFDGKLLHGEYKSFYRNMNLKELGRFSRGQKEGEWQSWFENGRIKERIHYKNGEQNGYDETYDPGGRMIARSDYRNGVLHGKTILYGDQKDSVIIYKNGQPLPPKIKKEKLKKSNADSVQRHSEKTRARVQDTTVQTPKSRKKPDLFMHKKDSVSSSPKTKSDTARKKKIAVPGKNGLKQK